MKRSIFTELVKWKHSHRRKPLILKGARQVGKTTILRMFGESEYDRVAYFNFEETPTLTELFEKNIDPGVLISNLSIQIGFDIQPEKDLIIFDEIQFSNAALNSLKYFNEKANHYHIACAGSMLGLYLSKPKSFPVGKVNFLQMGPMNFLEFLDAIDKKNLKSLIESAEKPEPIPQIFHDELIRLLRIYYFTGGMPDVVKEFIVSGKFDHIRAVQKEILSAYVLDFAKYSNALDIPRINMVWESIPTHLSKENKKFIFSAVKPGAKSREFENALQWLLNVGLIHKSYLITTPKQPLSAYTNRNIFKVFALDIGLLGALSKLKMNIVMDGDRLFTEYKGAFVENYVAQQLVSHFQSDLFYWTSNGKAEVDFIVTFDEILPLEAKSGINVKSKSLKVYREKYSPPILVRSTLRNLKMDGSIINIPLYAISQLQRLTEKFI